MTGAVLEALASHWRRNRLQLLTLVLGLALATALWSGVQAINAEARASYDAAAATLAEGRFHQLMPREGDSMPQALFVALRRAGWLVSPVVEGRLRVGGTAVRLVGVDPLTAPPSSAASEALARTDLNRFLRAETLVAGPEMAALLEANMPNPVLVDQAVAPGSVLADIGVVQKLLGRAGRISRLIVLPEQPLRQQPLADIAPDLVLQRADGATDVGRLTDSFHLNLTAFGFLSFAVGIFIVHGAIGLAFEQRRGVIRTLRALGVPLRRLVVLMIAELVVLATLAGALGIALGYLIAALLLPDVAATIRGLYGADVAGTLQIRPAWWLSGIAMALGGALLAAASGLWRLARMPVVASAGGRAWALGSGRTRTLQAAAAVVLLAAAGVLAVTGGGLAAGFALLACLLLGAALALPPCLAAILRLGEAQAVRAMAQWFWADTRQQLPGLGLALIALLLAMAANVGVSTMVSSFRLTFVGFLDQRLSAELYVDADAVADRAALERFLEAQADAVLPIMSVEATLAGLPAEIFGVRVGYTYRENWRFLDAIPAVWDEIEVGRAVVINEQLSRRAALHVGHTLALGPGLSLPVAGVVGDYGNPIGQAIVGEALFRQTFPAIEPSRFAMHAEGPLVFHGAGGYSVKSAKGQASYYYSQPFFSVEGKISLPEGEIPVRGTAWLDREWSSQPLADDQNGWDWFSLSFDTGEKLMGFRLRDAAGSGFTSATWIAADGAVTPYGDGKLVATPLETSWVEGREIPTRWRLVLPDRALDVTVGALNSQAWMGLSIPYWEGPVRVAGTHPGKGYLEMTGYQRR
ncbi:MAG: FtsX-like permease family protein [Mesorhizobium sp.]|uniref:lipocalin family protein n=6 Tax=Mesorhizobium sp. TaxID=1871066 RepID=UPI000FE306DC|nr:lipocalin family protein [Mesorhizobium sp.]RWJ06613.1 MAG: FtsX-like permease family protein [Mesorhizobium sp.]RWJ61319.1 MAG: FtsX-like permease family protein [Mesorhizobium sp.]